MKKRVLIKVMTNTCSAGGIVAAINDQLNPVMQKNFMKSYFHTTKITVQ